MRRSASWKRLERSAGRWIESSATRSSSPKSTDRMLSQIGKTHSGVIAGILALVLFVAAISLMPREWRSVLREKAFDIVLAADRQLRRSKPEGAPIVVVDIDRRSLDALGPWPWPRETMAGLVEAVAAGKPSVIAIDILFAQADSRSPAALARQLGTFTGKQD